MLDAIIKMQISEQAQQAFDCITAREYTAAIVSFQECIELTRALEGHAAAEAEEKTKPKMKQLNMAMPNPNERRNET